MPRLTPEHWRVLKCIFEKDGFKHDRTTGSHICLVKKGIVRPVVIPKYTEVDPLITSGLLKTAEMTRKRYFALRSQCR